MSFKLGFDEIDGKDEGIKLGSLVRVGLDVEGIVLIDGREDPRVLGENEG